MRNSETTVTTGADRGAVSQIQTFCLHDGEGIRTTVFLAGCPLRCRWCANPETWDTRRATVMTVADVVARCCRDRIFYHHSGGGVTISGGEPALQPQFLAALLAALTDEGLDTAMETSGWFDWEQTLPALRLVDFLFFDIKHMDPDVHRHLTGKSNTRILANIRKTKALDKDVVIRIPLVPGINTDRENLIATAGFVCQHVPSQRIELLPYHDWARQKYATLKLTWNDYPTPSEELIDHARSLLSEHGVHVVDFK